MSVFKVNIAFLNVKTLVIFALFLSIFALLSFSFEIKQNDSKHIAINRDISKLFCDRESRDR